MRNILNSKLRLLLLCGTLLVPTCAWGQTETAPATTKTSGAIAPPEAKQEGPPVRDGERTLFRFRAPADAVQVFLAGSFNGYANNQNAAVTDEQFAMTKGENGVFWTRVFVEPKTQQYKYVVQDANGQFNWLADPQVGETDADGNSVLDFSKVGRVPASLSREGVPLRDGDEVVFRFRAPSDTVKVFLAGSFNNYANNQNSVVTDKAFALTKGKEGFYSKRVAIGPTTEKYKYVVVNKNGQTNWLSDPEVKAVDEDGNTVIDFAKIESAK